MGFRNGGPAGPDPIEGTQFKKPVLNVSVCVQVPEVCTACFLGPRGSDWAQDSSSSLRDSGGTRTHGLPVSNPVPLPTYQTGSLNCTIVNAGNGVKKGSLRDGDWAVTGLIPHLRRTSGS